MKIISALLTIAFLVGCADKHGHRTKEPIKVVVTKPIKQTVPLFLNAVGHITPFKTVNILPQVSGEIVKVHVKRGAVVCQGDLLFTIDPRPYRAILKEAEGTLLQDKADFHNQETIIERNTPLLQDNFISAETFDNLLTQAEVLKGKLQTDLGAVEKAQIDLGFCSIQAPFSGKLGDILVDEGNVVSTSDTKTLVTLNQIDPIYVTLSISASALPSIKTAIEKETNHVSLLDLPGSGKVVFLDNTIDQTTGMIQVKALFSNPDAHLWPGKFVKGKIHIGEIAGGLVLPENCIQFDEKGPFVYLVDKDVVTKKAIVIGEILNDKQFFISEGIKEEDEIVLQGQINLYEGALVKVIEQQKEEK